MVVLHGKCIVVGDSTVGKTAIVQSFSSDGTTFPKSYLMSTNVDVVSKFVRLDKLNRESVDIFLFDTSGKAVFKDLTEVHFDKLGMYVIVFDVTDKNSFDNCQKWMKKLKQYIEPDKSILGVLLGNKIDLKQRRRVSEDAAKVFASNHGLTYFECSAKEYEGVEAPFRWLAEKYYRLHEESPQLIQQLE